MDAEKLKEILDKHSKWLCREPGGERANLCGAYLGEVDLSYANLNYSVLSRVNLRKANLKGAQLSYVDLRGANLEGANLSGARLDGAYLDRTNLSRTDLSGANLYTARLTGANLYGANLSGTDLCSADLYGADLRGAEIELGLLNKFLPICCPESGRFTAWKRAGKYIVKLEVLESAKRTSAYNRECRCSAAKVLAIENEDGTLADVVEANSRHNKSFAYRVGEIVKVDDFDDDRTNFRDHGIHFFITRQEAVDSKGR